MVPVNSRSRSLKKFRLYFHDKMTDAPFREFYERECHVCPNTLRIFEKMDRDHLSIEEVASFLQTDPQCLQKLLDADYCDPDLVVRLCRQLELPVPCNCPRRAKPSS
jgi:hypothetical protein